MTQAFDLDQSIRDFQNNKPPTKDIAKKIKIKPSTEALNVKPVAIKKTRSVFAQNPFLNFTVTANKRKMTVAKGSVIKGEVVEGQEDDVKTFETTIAQTQLVDEDKFIKVFTGQVSAIFDLTAAGIKMFGLLLIEAQRGIGGDMVFLTPAIVTKLAKAQGKTMSSSTFSRGISDLINAKILAACSQGQGWFYINPAIIFNGDRARFVTEYHKPKTHKLKANQTQLNFNLSPESPDLRQH